MITPYRPDDIQPFYPSVVDIETASNGSLLAIEWGYENEQGERTYKVYKDWNSWLSDLCALINSNRNNRGYLHKLTRIWAHNGANFDWLSLIEYIRDNNLAEDTQYILSNSTGIGVVIKLRSKETIRLYDSNRLLPGSLDKLCKEFKTSTTKDVVEKRYKSKMENFLAKYPDRFWRYLHNDVAALQEVIYKFWKMIYELEGSIGYLPMTLPSLALRIFRKRMGDNDLISVPWNKKVKQFSRRAYTGGRVECFQPGEHKNVSIYDFNSMYPAVMASEVYPSSARSGWSKHYRTDMLGLWEIEYEQKNVSVPAVLRDEVSGNFSYNGKGVYTTPEIELLKETGPTTLTITRGLVFQHSKPLFKEFVEFYYELKKQAAATGNTALAFVAKILMNSLYGKFGQSGVKNTIEQVKVSKIREVIAEGGKVRLLSDDYMVVQENDIVEHEFVAIAAYVTSYARILLYREMIKAGPALVYVDTDSLHVAGITLQNSDKLGELKLEEKGTGIYLGKKLYSIKPARKPAKIKAKGIGRAIRSGKITHATFKRLLDTKEVLDVTFDVFPTVKEVLSKSRPSCAMFTRTRRIRRLQ